MKNLLQIIFIIFTIQSSFGQVATIQDSDGWTSVRKAPGGKSLVIHKIYENEVFWYNREELIEEKEWISIYIPINDFSLGKSDPNFIKGFIHKSRLLPLEKLNEYSGEGFQFEYLLSEFDSTGRIIEKENGKWIVAIDGRPVWGEDGNFPKTQVNDIKVTIEKMEIQVHPVFYADIFECNREVSVYKNDETYFVYQLNSDGAGAYEIVWVFDKKGLKQRLIGTMV